MYLVFASWKWIPFLLKKKKHIIWACIFGHEEYYQKMQYWPIPKIYCAKTYIVILNMSIKQNPGCNTTAVFQQVIQYIYILILVFFVDGRVHYSHTGFRLSSHAQEFHRNNAACNPALQFLMPSISASPFTLPVKPELYWITVNAKWTFPNASQWRHSTAKTDSGFYCEAVTKEAMYLWVCLVAL